MGDVFGELGNAYALANAVFVGGSLRPLGGQNFLEPLARGVTPVIGNYWSNFAWVGREIVDQGLVTEVKSADALTAALLAALDDPAPKEAVKKRYEHYVAPKRGGSAAVGRAIQALLCSI